MRGNEWNCKSASALRRCHQMSDSAIPRAEYPKITATSRNMHITGKEKTSAAKPVQEVLAVGRAFSDDECEVVGNRCPLPISLRFSSDGLSTVPVPPQSLACVRTAPQPCQSKSSAMPESAPEGILEAGSAPGGRNRFGTCPGHRRAA